MSRRCEKGADNPFYKARMTAADYNERLLSRMGASEVTGVSEKRMGQIENGLTVPYPEEVVMMSQVYNAPELENYYCREMCPLGHDVAKVDSCDIDRITIRALQSFMKIEQTKNTLLEIVADGVISEGEKPDLNNIVTHLEELSGVVQNLKLWIKKNL